MIIRGRRDENFAAATLLYSNLGGFPGQPGSAPHPEDGSQAMVVPEGAHLKLSMCGVSPWMLEEDGRLHDYSLLLAVRLDRCCMLHVRTTSVAFFDCIACRTGSNGRRAHARNCAAACT